MGKFRKDEVVSFYPYWIPHADRVAHREGAEVAKKKVTRRKRCEHCGELPAKECQQCGAESDFHEFEPYMEDISGVQQCVDYCLGCHNQSCEDI